MVEEVRGKLGGPIYRRRAAGAAFIGGGVSAGEPAAWHGGVCEREGEDSVRGRRHGAPAAVPGAGRTRTRAVAGAGSGPTVSRR